MPFHQPVSGHSQNQRGARQMCLRSAYRPGSGDHAVSAGAWGASLVAAQCLSNGGISISPLSADCQPYVSFMGSYLKGVRDSEACFLKPLFRETNQWSGNRLPAETVTALPTFRIRFGWDCSRVVAGSFLL